MLNKSKGLTNQQSSDTITNYDVTIDDNDAIYLAFIQSSLTKNKIGYIGSQNGFQWNKTVRIIDQDNETYSIKSSVAIITNSNRLFIGYTFKNDSDIGIAFLTRRVYNDTWTNRVITEIGYDYNTISLSIYKEKLFLSWLDSHNGSMNLYFKYSQSSIYDWSPIYCISNTSINDCLSYDYLFDNEQNIHFVWSQETATKEAIFYRTFYENATISSIEQLTDGTTSCLNPRIVIDENGMLNLFYGNHTVESPDFYGTKTVNSRMKELSSIEWSTIFEVAPYTPPDRPGSNRADGYAPATIMDKNNRLWMAYRMDEDYAYRTGIDIRPREANTWQPSNRLTIIKTVTIKPHLLVDSQNNLHCFWMDYRNLVWDIFQRTKQYDDLWLPEYCITTGFTPKNNSWLFVGIFLGVAFALALPGIAINRLRARKRKKIINKKMSELKNNLK